MAVAKKYPPGAPGLPYFGDLRPLLADPIAHVMRNYRRYGEVVRVNFMGYEGAALHGAAANRYILLDAVENFLVGPLVDVAGARWLLGEGVLFIDEPAHRRARRLIMPAFHRKRLDGYQQIMAESTVEAIAHWKPGAEFDIAHEMHRLALTIVGRTLLSRDLSGASADLGRAVARLVATASNPVRLVAARLPFDVPGVGDGASLRRGQRLIHSLLDEVIAEHERDATDTGDVVSMLVAARDEDGSRLSHRQVLDNLLTLFVAGHETSANGLAWIFYLLAQHPAITTRLLEELDRELGGQPPTAADLERLTYLEQVVKEGLRLFPPVPWANRMVKDPFEWKGYRFESGNVVVYAPYVSHHMPDQFPEPELFRPERFDPASATPPPPYAYIPFAVGPRSCIGAPFATMEIKTVLATILPRFRLDLVPGQTVHATVRTTLQPKHGIRMRPQPQDGHTARSTAPVQGNVLGATPGPP
jgi:cytochrome P450